MLLCVHRARDAQNPVAWSRSCSLGRASGWARWPARIRKALGKVQSADTILGIWSAATKEDGKRCILASKINAWTFCFCGFVKLTCESWEAVTWVCCDTYLGSVRSYQHCRGYRHKICSEATQPNKFMHNLPSFWGKLQFQEDTVERNELSWKTWTVSTSLKSCTQNEYNTECCTQIAMYLLTVVSDNFIGVSLFKK